MSSSRSAGVNVFWQAHPINQLGPIDWHELLPAESTGIVEPCEHHLSKGTAVASGFPPTLAGLIRFNGFKGNSWAQNESCPRRSFASILARSRRIARLDGRRGQTSNALHRPLAMRDWQTIVGKNVRRLRQQRA
jgi:hypothetical protein